MGRAGVIVHRERHVGGFDIVHIKDTLDRTFATRYVAFSWFSLLQSHVTVQCYQHLRHWGRHQALDILTQGQGYQTHYFRGERCQEKKSGGTVNSLKVLFIFLSSSMLCMSIPTYDYI